MKLAYNPSDKPALTGVSSDNKDIIFDLSGIAIYARGVKFDGKTPTVFKKHTSANTGGYDGLVPAPSYAANATRFLREDGTWETPDKTASIHWDNIDGKPDVFNPSQHIHTTNDILSLTNYAKATGLEDLTTSDTLNVALGKLEYKSDLGVTAYDWYKSVTDEDTDEHINKWNEIVDFLNGVTDTTLNGILNNFINDLEVTGSGNAVTDVSKANNKITVTKGNSFLPLSGGTITGFLKFNTSSTATYVQHKVNDVIKAELGYHPNYGVFIKNENSGKFLYVTDSGVAKFDGNTIIHSGNIGNQSVNYATSSGNAASLDGHVNGDVTARYLNPLRLTNANTLNDIADGVYRWTDANNPTNYAGDNSALLQISGRTWDRFQLAFAGNSDGKIYYRQSYYQSSSSWGWGSWKTIAFTTDNVASATKLQTARTIWGKSFDGTGNVSGDLHLYTSKIYWWGDATNYCISSVARENSSPYLNIAHYGGISFNTSGYERMYIAVSGNVGIGTTSPVQKLDVNGNILMPNYYALMSRKNDGTGINLIYCGNDDVIKIGGSLPIKLQGNTTVTSSINLSGDWENDFGINFNEGGGTTYGFSLLYGVNDKFKLTTRNDSTTNTEVFSVGRGSTVVTFASTPKVGTTSVSLNGHTHTKSQITDFPISLPANGGNADTVDTYHIKVQPSAGTDPYTIYFVT